MDDLTQAYTTLSHARRSVRAYQSKPASTALLEKVFAVAQQAPSNCNTQPWQVVVASGAKCNELREKMTVAVMNGEYDMDFPYSGKYEGVYKERQYDAANCLYTAMGVTRGDKVGREAAFMRNFTFFDAPHVAFFFYPNHLV